MSCRGALFLVLVLACVFSPATVSAAVHSEDTTFDVNGTTSDSTDERSNYGYDYTDDYWYSSGYRSTDNTMTSGGRLTTKRGSDTGKLVTFQSNDSGHMVADSTSFNHWGDNYRYGEESYQTQTIFNRSGTLEEYGGYYSVKPIAGEISTYAITKVERKNLQVLPSSHLETWWGYTFDVLDAPGNYSQMVESLDRTHVTGDIRNFLKKRTDETYNPTYYYVFDEETGTPVYYRTGP